jgi:hypothetical protein
MYGIVNYVYMRFGIGKVFIFFIMCNYNVFGQNMKIYPSIAGLKIFDLPEVYSKEWYELNHSNENYCIDDTGNVNINVGNSSRNHIFETGDGALIGTNMGEWGGKLIFKNNINEYTILDENICGIINYNNGIYVLTGLSHLGISVGKIVKLEIINEKWEPTFSVEFGSSPEAFTVFENKLYIVTFNGLIAFDEKNINQLLNKQFWTSLYPQSIYINNDIIAIGMRDCVAIINRDNYEVRCYRK